MDNQETEISEVSEISYQNFIPYQVWLDILNRADISRGIQNFNSDEVNLLVNCYDKNLKYLDMQKIEEFEVIVPDWVLVPKFFWIRNIEKLKDLNAYLDLEPKLKQFQKELKDYDKEVINQKPRIYKSKIIPREEQIPAFKILEKLRYDKNELFNGIIKATPGFGKTVLTVHLINLLNFQKPIIIVPKDILTRQWEEAFLQFSDLKKEDIYLLEGSDPETIINGIKNSKVIIAKVQSLLSQLKRIPYNDLYKIYQEIDLFVFDECHGSGAQGYGKVSSIFKTNNIIGLTATPYRRGISDFLLQNSIGDVIFESNHKNYHPKIEIFNLNSDENTPLEFSKKEIQTLGWAAKNDYIKFLTFYNMFLYNRDFYFDYLAKWTKYQRSLGHVSVILFTTIKMIDKFIEHYINQFTEEEYANLPEDEKPLKLIGNSKIDSQNLAKAKNRELRAELKIYKEILNQRVKDKEIKRKEANELYKTRSIASKEEQNQNLEHALEIYEQKIKSSKVLVSNYGLLSAGFDKEDLSHIIFGSPIIGKVTVLQSIGRIVRVAENKRFPLVQFFFTSTFLKYQPNASMILKNNIMSEFDESEFEYKGF
jgi:superfamily II DNA or RNA helicase